MKTERSFLGEPSCNIVGQYEMKNAAGDFINLLD